MNVFGALPLNDNQDVDQAMIEVTAGVIQQYILEDGLDHEDKSDLRLERLMRTAERYIKRYMDVVNQHVKDQNWVSKWQSDMNGVFNDHASAYQRVYQPVSHMAEAPYFMTPWSVCFLVDSALKEHGIESKSVFDTLNEKENEELDYTIRFCENLIQTFHAEFFYKT